jgi:glutathione S-transferase
MLKIYGPPRSRAFRVIWLCHESNIPYEHVPVTINVKNAQCKEDFSDDLDW